MHIPFRYDFFFLFSVFIISVIYLFEPGVASVTNAYKKKWAGLGWAGLGLPLFHQKRLPAGFVRKPHFLKKLLAFGFVWLEIITHHTSHTFNTCHLSTARSHPASISSIDIEHPYQNCEPATHLMSQLQPPTMLKCDFFPLCTTSTSTKNLVCRRSLYWESSFKAEK